MTPVPENFYKISFLRFVFSHFFKTFKEIKFKEFLNRIFSSNWYVLKNGRIFLFGRAMLDEKHYYVTYIMVFFKVWMSSVLLITNTNSGKVHFSDKPKNSNLSLLIASSKCRKSYKVYQLNLPVWNTVKRQICTSFHYWSCKWFRNFIYYLGGKYEI